MNAFAPMLVKPSPSMVTAFRFPQSWNASAGIAVTVAGMVTRTARVLPLNTAASNAVTGFSPNVSGITSVVVSNETELTVALSPVAVYVHTLPDPSAHSSAHAQRGKRIAAPNVATTVSIFAAVFMFLSFPFIVVA